MTDLNKQARTERYQPLVYKFTTCIAEQHNGPDEQNQVKIRDLRNIHNIRAEFYVP